MKKENARKLYARNVDELLRLENPKGVKKIIEYFIKEKTATGRGVIGISGGVDSALTATLAANALGKENLTGLLMPTPTTVEEETKNGIEVAEKLGIKYFVIDIEPIVRAYKNQADFMKDFALNNAKPRMRMTMLYGFANANGCLVIGTDNKTEGTDYGVGYFTKYGDGGVDLNPIGDLYKTQVWQLASYVGVPEKIVKKIPTAGLWTGQTDEGELGIDYRTLDKVLLGFELEIPDDMISKVASIDKAKIYEIRQRRKKNLHKGKAPPSVKIREYA